MCNCLIFSPLFAVLFLSLALSASATNRDVSATSDCKPAAIDRWAQVDYVHDGDTLWLDDGVKVRVIGLNAPEVARKHQPGEPLAKQAREMLRRQVVGRVGLEYDQEREDRYGRLLAHIYTESRDNVAAGIIAAGFAHAITYPPNLKHRHCYQSAEQAARQSGKGVWGHRYFRPIDAANVARGGFMRVRGCVQSVRDASGSRYLSLAPRFRLKASLAAADVIFKFRPLPELQNTCMVVRGWVYNDRAKQNKILTLRHPDAVETMASP